MGSKITNVTLCPSSMVTGKKEPRKLSQEFQFLTPVFAALSSPVPEVAVDMMVVIEWYVVLLYGRMSGYVLVNQA